MLPRYVRATLLAALLAAVAASALTLLVRL
jgi:hypothetical protein